MREQYETERTLMHDFLHRCMYSKKCHAVNNLILHAIKKKGKTSLTTDYMHVKQYWKSNINKLINYVLVHELKKEV